jgi:glutamyl/glutaminyl-tRNA synthetase
LLSDITDAVPYFFGGAGVNVEEEVQTTVLDLPESQEVLKAFVEQGESWEWTEHNLHEKLEAFRGEFKEKGIKPKATMWAIRAAISGRTRGADMIGLLEVLGKERTIYRAQKSCKVAK